MPLRYVDPYKQVTMQETGFPGPLYYHGIGSILTVLVAGIATVFLPLCDHSIFNQ